MRRKSFIYFIAFCSALTCLPFGAIAGTNKPNLILLQVEEKGEAWYVCQGTRTYLGSPAQAFKIMGAKGLGISNSDLALLRSRKSPGRLTGRILLAVEDRGQAYYVDNNTYGLVYLGRPADAFELMRKRGLGITNTDLEKIPIDPDSSLPPESNNLNRLLGKPSSESMVDSNVKDLMPQSPIPPLPAQSAPPADKTFKNDGGGGIEADKEISLIEREAFEKINSYRAGLGLKALSWNAVLASAARTHSHSMASQAVPFGHDGFDARFEMLRRAIGLSGMAENVAYNYNSPDPVGTAVSSWLNSSGHKENIEGSYDYTGIGVVSNGQKFYFTQIFGK